MEDLNQSSFEEKADLGNLVLFPPDSYVNKEIDEVNVTIKDEPSENKINCDISDEANIKTEVIETPVYEYEKVPIEISTHSNENCQTCGLKFGNKAVLKIHNSIIHPEGRQIDQNKIIESVHEGIKKFKCTICDFNCAQKYHLNKHTETVHEGIRPFKCNICNYETCYKGTLKKHIEYVHKGLKPFKCKFCSYECARNYHLMKHIESVHERIKPFKCKLCDYECAKKKSYLKKHIESVHEGMKTFKCSICNYKTSYKSYLKNHFEGVHKVILQMEEIVPS